MKAASDRQNNSVSNTMGSQARCNSKTDEIESKTSEACVRILIVDDHPVVRRGLIACLSSHANLIVVGEAADGLEAIQKTRDLLPNLVLIDVEMPKMNGLIATECICKEFPKTKVLILSVHDKQEYLVQAIQGGARGFAQKNLRPEELVKAINIVHRGEPFFHGQPSLSQSYLSKRDATNHAELFDREKEVLIHLATGFLNREIADTLKISVRTVESHRARLMKKLNIHTVAGLTRYALTQGFITLNSSLLTPSATDHAIRFPRLPNVRV
jgi:two-component system nitrate/nitrite response regulator NarL